MGQASVQFRFDDYCVASRLLVLFAAIAAFFLLRPLLLDPDYYWHLETGRLIFEQEALPSRDIFSYTYAGQDWVLHEWLFQLVLFLMHAFFDEVGVKLLCAASATATLVVVYGTVLRLSERHVAAAAAVLVLLFLLLQFILPRPQIASLLLMAITLRALLLAKYRGELRPLYWLPPAMVLWVNLHGGFAVGLAAIMVFAACEWLQALISDGVARQQPYLRRLLLISALALLAACINPDGPQHLLYPFETVGMAATAAIVEWQQPDMGGLGGRMYLLAVGVFATLSVYRRERPDLTEIALPCFLIGAGFISVRHVPFAALTMVMMSSKTRLIELPWLNRIGRSFRRLRDWRRRRSPATASHIGAAEIPLNLLACLALVAGCIFYYPTATALETAKLIRWLPVEAADFIAANDIDGRMFNSLHFGGYLLHRLQGHPPVFIDGRVDMYGDRFFAEYLTLNFMRNGWEGLLDKHGIDLLITTPETQISKALQLQGSFALVFRDKASVVLLRRTPRNAAAIAKFAR